MLWQERVRRTRLSPTTGTLGWKKVREKKMCNAYVRPFFEDRQLQHANNRLFPRGRRLLMWPRGAQLRLFRVNLVGLMPVTPTYLSVSL